MVNERLRDNEKERKRRRELSRFSRNLSYKILSADATSPIGSDIPDATLLSFHERSRLDRDAYWKAKEKNFGLQMMEWIGDYTGKPGMADWVRQQKEHNDPVVLSILQEIGLVSTSEEQAKNDLQNPAVVRLVGAINKDLEKIGDGPIDSKLELDEEEERSLIFYARFLSGERKQEEARELIDTIVSTALRESNGDIDATIANLDKVAPLFRVAGEEGQHAFGALMVAKAHAADRDALKQIAPDALLTPDEAHVLAFLQQDRQAPEKQFVLEAEKAENLETVFAQLQPEPTPGHTYWIDTIPTDFTKKLTPEALRNLELRKPFWNDDSSVSREVFDPAYVLKDDKRFQNTQALTQNDSGLLALSAASAETPEKQALLYQTLAETVLRVHVANPHLVGEFLSAQNPTSRIRFADNDGERAEVISDERTTQLWQNIAKDFKTTFHVDIDPRFPVEETPEQAAFIDGKMREAVALLQPFQKDLLENFSQYPDRLVSLQRAAAAQDAVDQFPLEIDIPKTLAVWPERVNLLQEVLQQAPLTLTPEQIRQIEFLAHSVDVVTIMHMLQGTQAIAPEATIEQPSEQHGASPAPLSELSKQEVEEPAEVYSQRLTDMFKDMDGVYEDPTTPPGILPRRQELRVADTVHLSTFSTENEDIRNFEITNDADLSENKRLAIYDIQPGQPPAYNAIGNTFLQLLTRDNSLSDFELRTLGEKFKQNTLLAYVLEAAVTPEEQAQLFTNIFLQVARMYADHDGARVDVHNYFQGISGDSPSAFLDRLFGSKEATGQRLHELTEKLSANEELSFEDVTDMGMYALPFDLQHIVGRMKLQYQMTHVTPLPPSDNPEIAG